MLVHLVIKRKVMLLSGNMHLHTNSPAAAPSPVLDNSYSNVYDQNTEAFKRMLILMGQYKMWAFWGRLLFQTTDNYSTNKC